jgi:pyridoxine kinase
MAILSIQSHVVYGAAGNSAAVFPLKRLGNEVWDINTVEFSNHTGYGAWRGSVLDAGLVDELMLGLDERGVLEGCRAVLSGYMGGPDIARAVSRAVSKVRGVVPQAAYCCDPVMGDVGRGFYVKPGISELFRDEVVPRADIVTPNLFELEALTGGSPEKRIEVDNEAKAAVAIEKLHRMGPKVVLLTSFRTARMGDSLLGMIASGPGGMWKVTTPYLDFKAISAGSGDLSTAVFLSNYLKTGDLKASLEMMAASVFGIMKATFETGSRELLLVQAQEELVNPKIRFEAEALPAVVG